MTVLPYQGSLFQRYIILLYWVQRVKKNYHAANGTSIKRKRDISFPEGLCRKNLVKQHVTSLAQESVEMSLFQYAAYFFFFFATFFFAFFFAAIIFSPPLCYKKNNHLHACSVVKPYSRQKLNVSFRSLRWCVILYNSALSKCALCFQRNVRSK